MTKGKRPLDLVHSTSMPTSAEEELEFVIIDQIVSYTQLIPRD